MLRIIVNKSASGAKKYYSEKYYSEGNKRQDYYSEKDQSIGEWHGKSAALLGLNSEIDKKDFASLCDNLRPGLNTKLNGRINDERRVGYDFTFNASKSVSLAYTFGSDEDKRQILNAFQESVKDAMLEIETGIQTRIRKGGQNSNRETGNIVYGEFVHFTSRPVDGTTDPHLHSHCFVFNTTYDPIEKKWKAADFGQINKDAPYYEAVFHSSFANRLQGIGYRVKKAKTGFELKGIERETIEKFSRRTEEIEKLATEKGIINKDEKAKLGSKTRESKRKSISELDQDKEWKERLSVAEKESLKNLKTDAQGKKTKGDSVATKAIEYSIDHNFERKSVVPEKEILTTALKSSIGKTTIKEVRGAYENEKAVFNLWTRKKDLETFVTSWAALHEENNLLAKALVTKGCFKPIQENYQPKNPNLTDEQKEAVQRALTTSDGITIIAGKAGTG